MPFSEAFASCTLLNLRTSHTALSPLSPRLTPLPRARALSPRTPRATLPLPTLLSLAPTPSDPSGTAAFLPLAQVLAGPVLNVFTLVMVIRIVLTWYPRTDLAKAPWIFLAVPTEPLLAATRKAIPPVGGVDISPIVWVAISTFVHEILMGPQGLLVLMAKK